LGYKAIPAGNDVGLSIPIAIQAGMGELSRMGTVIHEKYGSRVRLGKVYTELELTPDKPITFGVTEFCKRCKKCADACPSHSISLETEPTIESKTGSISNNPGVRKWYHNNETCFKQWEVFATGCGICIAVCPFNKLDSWVHHVAKIAVGVPIGRDIARQMDDMFGYGKMNDKNVKAFWNKKT
jgi:reductive dehalogenase